MLYYGVLFTCIIRENNLEEIGGGCIFAPRGELAQLARALAWHARGHRFDSGILHSGYTLIKYGLFFVIAVWELVIMG